MGLEIPIYADQAVVRMNAMVTGANQDNHHLVRVHPQRDFKITQVADLRTVTAQDPCPRCRGELTILRGIEVGHIFKLGHKYSKALKAVYLDQEGAEQYILHGLLRHRGEPHRGRGHRAGPRRERHHLPHGPGPGAGGSDPHFRERRGRHGTASLSCTRNWRPRGIEVLLDDRDERPGVKFKDCDLLGIPLRVVIGAKTLAQGQAEVKERRAKDPEFVPLAGLPDYLKQRINEQL